ncbi:MAG: sugar ABC transporter substrate-binding protein [Candidatus Cohnella colombiensis]|uniref:Sugar ABC transporter substrate-binding protein n=1 Tax=Candidatus Cohnella colombiensis TaxID=3121368 RepID=A0AA95JAP5_9BACL|nr:MAG: sugar ABC transporter substrate-binding protein [Cohnella sp.]
MGARARKVAFGLLMLIMVFSVVAAGCSSSNKNKDGSPSASQPASSSDTSAPTTVAIEPMTISVFLNVPGPIPTDNNRIYKKIKDELGVTLKEEYLVGDLEQKLGVMIAGGDYPDIISANVKLTAANAVLPLEDLIEQHAPNLKKHYEDVWNLIKDPDDGHIYWLPNFGVYQGDFKPTQHYGPAFFIQRAVLKEYNYPKFKTLDEYFKLIEDYQAKYPEIDGQPTIGFTALAFDWRDFGLRNAPQHLIGHPNDGGVVVDPVTNVAELFESTDIAKPYYKKLNEINSKGLMDKEAFAQNYDQYMAKIASGRVLGMFDQRWNFQQGEESLISQGKSERAYVGLPLVYDVNTTDYYLDRPVVNLNNGFGITVNADDPVKIIKVLDTLMTEKWQKLFYWGEEGIDYHVGDNGLYYRTPEQRKDQEDVTWKQANKADSFYGQMPKLEGNYPDGNADSPGNQPDEFFANLKDIDREVLQAYGYKVWTDFFSAPPPNRVSYPAWNIDLIEGSEARVSSQKMKDLALKYLPKAILTSPENFDSVWAEYGQQVSKANPEAYLNRVNEQLKWRQDNWGK